jgi:hypothetical protein
MLVSKFPAILKEEWKKRTADSALVAQRLTAELREKQEEKETLFKKYLNDDPHIVKVYGEWDRKFDEDIAALIEQIAILTMEQATFE